MYTITRDELAAIFIGLVIGSILIQMGWGTYYLVSRLIKKGK